MNTRKRPSNDIPPPLSGWLHSEMLSLRRRVDLLSAAVLILAAAQGGPALVDVATALLGG